MRTPDGLLFLDRTRNSTDLKCRRMRYWAFEWRRRGISARLRGVPLEMGSIIHDALAHLLEGREIDEVAAEAVTRHQKAQDEGKLGLAEERVLESQVLLEGMLRGWHRFVLPRILSEYHVIKVEGEVIYDFLGCRLGAKPDVLLRRKGDQTLWYVEWKTTSTMSPEYFNSWTKAVQLHAGALGVARTIGEEIAGAIVFCIYKGYWNKKYRRQESIFCYGYGPRDNGDHAFPQRLAYEYKPGLIKYPIVDIKRWVAEMPEDVLSEQFADTGPVLLDERLCEAWLRQTAIREKEIDHAVNLIELAASPEAREEILDRYFQQNFNECLPAFGGFRCSYHDACHVKHIGEDPIGSGIFDLREAHHTTDPVWMVEE
jgi:hypothetical protein